MTKFLLIRHGESEVTGRLSGRTSGVNLSEFGKKQIKNLAERLRQINVDKIICSPVDRTKQTAQIISEHLNKSFETNDSFIEIDFGEWTGKSWNELNKLEEWKLYNTFRSGTRIPGGELISEVQNRMITGIEKLIKEYPEKTIIIVSHGDPIKTVIMYYAGIPLDFILRLKISTASVSVLKVDSYNTEINCINITDGIPELE